VSAFLTQEQRAAFRRDGALFPLPALTPEEVAEMKLRLEVLGRARAGRLPPALNLKPHLLVPWLWRLVHDPRILDPVESLLGTDLLCWGSSFFDKAPSRPEHVHWHQDATYWGLTRPDAVTAWVAFTPSAIANGCMRVVPGTHDLQLPHVDSFDADNMLPGREMLADQVDEARAVDVELVPGEMSLHHLLAVHGSRPNASGERRTGFAIRYIAGDLKQTSGSRGSATLVRGCDRGTFDLEREPEGEMHPAALKRHASVLRQATRIVAAEVQRTRQPSAEAP
jgi:non-haem Fe2+, alpha-ketoglutarate-dependent halogenase